jgi:hypothetical protein
VYYTPYAYLSDMPHPIAPWMLRSFLSLAVRSFYLPAVKHIQAAASGDTLHHRIELVWLHAMPRRSPIKHVRKSLVSAKTGDPFRAYTTYA